METLEELRAHYMVSKAEYFKAIQEGRENALLQQEWKQRKRRYKEAKRVGGSAASERASEARFLGEQESVDAKTTPDMTPERDPGTEPRSPGGFHTAALSDRTDQADELIASTVHEMKNPTAVDV